MDEARAETFAKRMQQIENDAGIALMASIGHQTGLFDAMDGLPPSTSDDIATAAALDERYVREWLGAMVTGRVIDYDPKARTFQLPPEHAASLTRSAGPGNMARDIAMVGMMAEVEQRIVACFRNGGGVPYSAYPRFQEQMAEDSAAINDRELVSTILPIVPGLVERLERGIDVADIGCGAGHAINLMASAYPRSRFSGFDLARDGIATAIAESAAMGLANTHFAVADVATLDAPASFDFISAFDAIHDQARPAAVLDAIARALRPDGTFLMVDIDASSDLGQNRDIPWAPWLYTISLMHCMTVSLAVGGAGLGAVWGRELAVRMLADAGFSRVEVKPVEADTFNAYYVCTR